MPSSPDQPRTSTEPSPGSSPASATSDQTGRSPSSPTRTRRQSRATSSPSTRTGDDPSARSPASPPTGSGSSSLSAIRYEDRVFITGATGTGKSSLALALFRSAAAPRVVIDPQDSKITAALPGTVTFRDPARPTTPEGHRWTEAATARFVPGDPDDLDAYDRLYRQLRARSPIMVWLDEAGQAMPAQGYPRAGNTFVVQGRKRMQGHMALHTRPREVCRNLIAQATHVFTFRLPNPADRRHLADLAGVPPAEFDRALASLPEHGFLWWDSRAQRLSLCDPLRL